MVQTYLCFRMHDHLYAIENTAIIRIGAFATIDPLPIQEHGILGLGRLEEQLIPILDLDMILWNRSSCMFAFLLYLMLDKEMLGICVEEIMGLQYIDEQAWLENDHPLLPLRIQEGSNWLYLLKIDQLFGR